MLRTLFGVVIAGTSEEPAVRGSPVSLDTEVSHALASAKDNGQLIG